MKRIEKNLRRYSESQLPAPNAPMGLAEFWQPNMNDAHIDPKQPKEPLEQLHVRLESECAEHQMVIPKYRKEQWYSPFENTEGTVSILVGYEIVAAVTIPVYRKPVTSDEIKYPVIDHWEKIPETDPRAAQYVSDMKVDNDELS